MSVEFLCNDYSDRLLADNTSQDIRNHVDDVVLLRAEILEVWTEQARQYVTAGIRWNARDYNLSLTKQRREPGYLVEGSEEIPSESGEAWTFMRIQDGKGSLVVLLLAERARSECARPTRAIEDRPAYP